MSHQSYPNRQSHRYKGFDYASAGAYFVTFCVRYGNCWLGEIIDGEMILSDAGRAVEACWYQLPERYPTIGLDEFRIMPNHAHLVIWLQEAVGGPLAAPDPANISKAVGGPLAAPGLNPGDTTGAASSPPTVNMNPRLDQVMRTYKSLSAIAVNACLRRRGQLWQRDYWDRIIRDEVELENVRHYIRTNPTRWVDDQLHPDAPPNKFNRWENT